MEWKRSVTRLQRPFHRTCHDASIPYGRRTSGVRALWVAARSSARHTDDMTGTTTETTFVAGAAGFIGCLLLLTLSLVAAQARTTDSIRTIDVVLSRYAFAPERIEVRVGEPVRLNIVSMDSTHGFQVKALGLNVRIPARGRMVTIDLTPKEPGTFPITCSEYCGSGHSRMKAWLIVSPDA